jgi:L-ascorbate metabolism protein UlaG (beta-lactamase superfamily)
MRVTFLAHSGFLVELPAVTLLFDWWKGTLPPLRSNVPLLVFASHRHEDHFSTAIFSLGADAFLLGKDLKPRSLRRRGVTMETLERCVFLGGNETVSPLSGVTVETLPSTDEGVAFLVTAEGETVFHAGDLNWWHWAGEAPAWNRNMAANFKRYIEPLRGRRIDLAMLPLDPRLGEDGFLGPQAFLDLADIRRCLPMHQWEDFRFTDQFLSRFPAFARQITPVTENGQVFDF